MSDVVTVQVSRELLERLTLDWSEPVQIMIRATGHPDATHEMICRRPAPAALIPSGFRLSGGGDAVSAAHQREQRIVSPLIGNEQP